MKKLFATFCLLTICSGCASLGPQFQAKQDHTPGQALIYVYRVKHFAGAALSPDVKIDNKAYGELGNGAYLPIEIAPGSHKVELVSVAGPVCAMDFNIKSADDYYLRFDSTMNNGAQESTTYAQQAALGPGGGGAMGAAMTQSFYASKDEKASMLKNRDARLSQPANNPGFIFIQPDMGQTEIKNTKLGKLVPQ